MGATGRTTEDDVARALALEKSLFGGDEQPFSGVEVCMGRSADRLSLSQLLPSLLSAF